MAGTEWKNDKKSATGDIAGVNWVYGSMEFEETKALNVIAGWTADGTKACFYEMKRRVWHGTL